MGGDRTVCHDHAWIEDAKGSGVEWLFPLQITVMRYLFATEGARCPASRSSETWVYFPATWFYLLLFLFL